MNREIILGVAAFVVTVVTTVIIKKNTNNFRRPNGKRGGGLISFHASIAFSIVTLVWLYTRDLYITSFVTFLAIFLCRQRIVDKKHYIYQVLFGVVYGVLSTYGVFYLYDRRPLVSIGSLFERFGYTSSSSSNGRFIKDTPSSAVDDRAQADLYPDLTLDDI